MRSVSESGSAAVVLAVDLGKTSCRMRVTCGGSTLAEAHGPGAPGLAEADGAELAYRAIAAMLPALGAVAHAVTAIGVGAAGAATAPTIAAELIRRLRTLIDVPVAVLSDALAAHAGAFAGDPGTVLIAGTGAVVFTITAEGAVHQVDGWGPWLGDEGGGRWIGQHGLQAALRAHDGRGPATALLADAAALADTASLADAAALADTASLADTPSLADTASLAGTAGATNDRAVAMLPIWVSQSGEPARRLGSFAPTVITRAEEGDAVSRDIVDEAVRRLANACAAAREPSVCVTGGLATHPFFAARLDHALRVAGLQESTPNGDPLTGAALVATDHSLPYEKRTTRG
jgi:N-acetylglucosamine kinase-like BadF-type ATPase